MEIEEYDGIWNSFSIKIPQSEDESDEKYLEKVVNVLDLFYLKNNFLQDNEGLYKPSKEFSNLSDLTHELNFSGSIGMKLSDGKYMGCDVKYCVKTRETRHADGCEGIEIWSHKEEWRKPQIDFLKEKWRELEYNL